MSEIVHGFRRRTQRPEGWCWSVTYVDGCTIMVENEGQAPYVLCFPRDPAVELERMRQWHVDSDHAWAARLNAERDRRLDEAHRRALEMNRAYSVIPA